MGFPIAVGGKTLSCRPLTPPSSVPPLEDNREAQPNGGPLVTMAVSSDQKLSVTCTIYYYDLISDSEEDGRLAQLHVQVSALGDSCQSKETVHPIPLSSSTETNETRVAPSVVFASDGRHVACLIPSTPSGHGGSVLVVLQLRRPKPTHKPIGPPRPSYLGPAPLVEQHIIPICTHPKVVSHSNQSLLTTASCLADASTHLHYKEGSCVLVVGCTDGSLVAVAYRPAQVAGILHRPSPHTDNPAIYQLTHRTFTKTPHHSEGRLCALVEPHGNAIIFKSQLFLEESTEELGVQMEFLQTLSNENGFGRAAWISQHYLATLPKHPGTRTAAHVWVISSEQVTEISTLTMTCERLQEYQHGSFSLSAPASTGSSSSVTTSPTTTTNSSSNDKRNESLLQKDNDTEEGRRLVWRETTSLDYDDESGALALCFLVLSSSSHTNASMVRPYACLWHWRTNVVGLTLACKTKLPYDHPHDALRLSHVYFTASRRLVHVLAHTGQEQHDVASPPTQHVWLRQQVYRLAFLSPPSVVSVRGHVGEASSMMMLSSHSVTFPAVGKPLVGDEGEVQWKEAAIPSEYTASFGPPRIAAIGRKRCRSIAVASSRGLCILDGSRAVSSDQSPRRKIDNGGVAKGIEKRCGMVGVPKWRLFSRQAQEKSFRVLAMTWWEGHGHDDGKTEEHVSDDLVVALVQSHASDPPAMGGPHYLSCWSRRRLDLQSQLLRGAHGGAGAARHELGIPLPFDAAPTSISLLSDPSYRGNSSKRRAVVLFTFTDDSSTKTDYLVCQLQVVAKEESDRVGPDDRYYVSAHICSYGTLRSSGNAAISTAFLASASFQFDLLRQPLLQIETDKGLATVAIISSPARGIDVVVVTTSGVTSPVPLIHRSAESEGLSLKRLEVSSFWQSQIIYGVNGATDTSEGASVDGFFVWSVMTCDGSLFCWTLPYLDERHDEVVGILEERVDPMPNTYHDEEDCLVPPSFLCSSEDDNAMLLVLLGTVVPIGDSSIWLQEASNVNRGQFSLGCLPGSEFGCVLRCSQSSRQLHRVAPGETEASVNPASFLDHEIFYLGDSVMSPPAFVSSVYSAFLGAANDHVMQVHEGRSLPRGWDFGLVKRRALSTLDEWSCDDTRMTALRILVLRAVELVSQESEKPRSNSVLLATAMFAEIVEAARSLLPPMHFVSLFLGVGRQIEPKCLPYLFPLPLSAKAFREDADAIERWRTVEDLYIASLYSGSLSAPSSALPLFPSKRVTLNKCIELLKRCLQAFEESANIGPLGLLDASGEERGLVKDLYLFGVKLEDAGLGDLDERQRGKNLEGNEEDSASTTSSFVRVKVPQNGRPRRKSRSICHLLSPSIFMSKYSRAKDEDAMQDAIQEAASSFISSGFEESDYEFIPASQHNVPLEIFSSEEKCETSVAGTVVDFLLSLCLDHKTSKPYFRWKKAHALARVFFGGEGSHIRIHPTSPHIAVFGDVSAIVPGPGYSVLVRATQRKRESIDDKQLVADLLTVKIMECDFELEPSEALLVLRLTLALLTRHDKSKDVESCMSGLVFLGVVAAHVAGVAKELLGPSFELCAIGSCYALALSELEQAL